MPEDYAAQLPCFADRVMAGFDPDCAALLRPGATVMTTEFPSFPIGYTFGKTHTNQRASRGAFNRLRAGFAPGSLQKTNLHQNEHGWEAPNAGALRSMDFAGCVQIATEILPPDMRHAPRADVPGLACWNKPVFRPIGESERGLTTCR